MDVEEGDDGKTFNMEEKDDGREEKSVNKEKI